jgi:hypothetical protein
LDAPFLGALFFREVAYDMVAALVYVAQHVEQEEVHVVVQRLRKQPNIEDSVREHGGLSQGTLRTQSGNIEDSVREH